MADQRRYGRPRSQGERHRPPTPEHVDPEVTPPPHALPPLDSLPGADTIPPAIDQRLAVLADGLGNVTQAIGRLWDGRHDDARLTRIETTLGGYVQTMARHDESMTKWVEPFCRAAPAQFEAINVTLAKLGAGFSDVAESIREVGTDLKLRADRHAERIEAVETVARDNSAAIEQLEHEMRPSPSGLIPRLTKLEQQLRDESIAETAVEKTKAKFFTTAKVVIGLLCTAFGAGVVKLIDLLVSQ